ncbi:Alpha/beta knot methyltransferase [Pelagophyceae sp. CCMP2097]|nr:Alpha/beta knot methyltransferase [Pelagophyceae sp. CCMP2097]
MAGGDADDGILCIKGGVGPAGTTAHDAGAPEPATYLVVHGIKSDDNLGSLIRTAGAFAAREVLIVNAERCSKRLRKALRTFGAHGAERRVAVRAFRTFEALVRWAKAPPRCCLLVGIEIDDSAVSCYDAAAFGSPGRACCFMPGNEGTGLTPRQLEACDALVYIPHYGPATASLNVNAATAVVLSAFAHAKGYNECSREGPKYDVRERLHHLYEPKDSRRGPAEPGAEPPTKQRRLHGQPSPRPAAAPPTIPKVEGCAVM